MSASALTSEQQDMLYAAAVARASGFPRVEIDPNDVLALFQLIERLEREATEQRSEREASEVEVESLYKLLRSVRDCLDRHVSNPEADARGMASRLSALIGQALKTEQ